MIGSKLIEMPRAGPRVQLVKVKSMKSSESEIEIEGQGKFIPIISSDLSCLPVRQYYS